MSQDERNAEIRRNKGCSSGKGRKFKVTRSESVQVTDSIALSRQKVYVNLSEFVKACKARWNLKKKGSKMRWQDL